MMKWYAGMVLVLAGVGMASPVRAQLGGGNGPPPSEPIPEAVYSPSLAPQAASSGPLPGQPPDAMSLPDGPNAFADDQGPAPPTRFWFRAEYLFWWIKRASPNTPLVTTSTSPDIATNVGALDESATAVLFDGPTRGRWSDPLLGGRFSAGVGPDFPLPLEADYLWLRNNHTAFSAHSNGAGSPVLARPIFATDPDLNQETVEFGSFPNLDSGGITVKSSSRIWGIEGLLTPHLVCKPTFNMDFLIGYRYTVMNEDLSITNTAVSLDPTNPLLINLQAGTATTVSDVFQTHNAYNSGELGGRVQWICNNLTIMFTAKVALGDNEEVVDIHGVSTGTTTNGQVTLPGGLMAVASNSGHFVRDRFTILPEGDLNLGYEVSPGVKLLFGYSFLYWNNVVRPEHYVDRFVDVRQAPTSANFQSGFTGTGPTFQFRETNFWAQGADLGLSISF